jgi:hypothetical protein
VREIDLKEDDFENYGSKCFSGSKVLCRVDPEKFKSSGIFDKYLDIDESSGYTLKWFGTAPLCNATVSLFLNTAL